MSSCTINSRVIKALKSLAKKRKWSDEEFKQYCIDHNYDFEQIMNWGLKDNAGVPEKVAPVIPSVNQVSKLDGYVPDELDNSNTILSYYSDFPEEHIKMRKEFNQDVLTSTFVDINADEVFKNPVKYLGREGNLLNNELRNLKIKYINTLLDLIKESDNVDDLRINPDDTNVVKYKKYDTALKWAWNRIQSFKDSENYRTILNLYVKAKYFDSMVDSIPYIEVNKAYSNIFDNKHYTYVTGKIKHFTGLSSEEASAESQMSNMAKMIIDYLPETMFVDGKLKIINNTTVGLDAFYSMANRFKVWLYANKNDKNIGKYLKDEWRKGVNANFYELLNLWRSKDNIGTLERNKLNTIINVIYGKYDDGRNVAPDDMRDVFSELIRTTVTSAYVDVSTEQSETGEVRIKPTTLTEKRYLELMDPIVRNFIAGAWNYYSNHIEVTNIKDGQGIIDFLKDALFAHYIPSYDEFSENNNIANPKANSIDILNKVFIVFKQMAINNHPSEKEEIVIEADYIKNWYDTLRGKGQNQDFYSAILNFTKTISLSSRTSFKSVIKNSEGNYMPLRQLPSLAYMKDEQYLDVEDSEYSTENIIHENIDNVEVPLVRSSTVNNVADSSSFRELSFEDMMTEAIVTDFLYNFNNPVTDDKGKKKTVIRVQPNCYADKSTNGVPGFNVSNPWKMEKNDGTIMEVYLNRLLRSVLNGKDNGQAESLLVETWRIHWNREIRQEYKTLAEDYKNIFNLPKEVSDDDAIAYFENYMLTNKVEDFIKLAYGKVDVISNVHYSEIKINGKKKVVFNPIIKGLLKLTSSKEEFNKYYKQGLEKFVSKLASAWRYIGNEQSVIEHFTNENSIWLKTMDPKESPYDQKIASDTTIGVKLTDGDKINPLVVAYFLAHNLLGESYNRYLFGNYYGHDIKASAINENGEYINLDELISSAWVSQTKRLAVVGATVIPYALGKKYGVADEINIAVVEDETAVVYNTNGEADEIDAKDGSGDVSPLFSRQANTSLQHASAGSNKKTIWHFYDHKHKTAGMLKWAEYEISNERMRDSWNSPTKEFIKFKKMHSLPFTSEQKMALADYVDDNRNDGIKSIYRNFEKLVYMNFNTGEYFKIKSIELFYDSSENTLAGYVTHDDNTNSTPIEIDSIFDLFQLMGGPWCYEWDKSAEKYIGSEKNLDILNAIVCEKGLKSNFIAYLSNKSGMKTGIKNLNSVSVLSNDDDLMYFTEKVKYGGLQMNADHTLEESESTEPTQMIAHVGQDGTSHELVRNVYSLLANDINLELLEYIEAVDNKDRDKLVELVGKEIVKSFNSGDKDTISLAQTFIARASRTGDYNLPFNSDSINGLFTTALFSMFSKKAARRKYAGIGAVLNPSYNSKMYYRYDGKNYKFEEITKIIRNYIIYENLQGVTINDVLTKPYLNGKLNRFMSEPIYDVNITGQTVEVNPIEIGGEYIIHYTNELDESGTPRYEKIKIDTLEDLLKYKHRFLPGNYQYIEITRNTLAPMNLRGIDATYSLDFENNIYKISQVENPYNLALLHLNGKIDLDSIAVDEDSITASLIKDAKNIIAKTSEESNQKTIVRNMQKAFFNRLKINDSWNINGKEYSVLDITVKPTEIMIGRLYAKQLGLLPGDNLSDINDVSFFEKRMFDYYSTTDNPDNGKYDAILFDGAGKKLYVKVDEKLEVNNYLSNDDFQDRDGYIYNESKQICSSDGKRFVKYIDSNGRSHDYVIVNNIDRVNEIAKGHYTYLYKNILPENVFNLGLNVGQEDVKKYASMARRVEYGKLVGFIKATAHNKFTAFNKSLNFVGTRIPCQSMQSFTPMRVVAFTDSYDNQIYIPTHEQWIEGSDYDIDKQYIIGYDLLNNGRLPLEYNANSSSYIKEIVIKNKIIDSILEVISSHKNLVNLTATVSTENLKKLKDRASAKELLDSSNPADVFNMIVENAAGKDTIGITAVAGKGFAAICYYYNDLIDRVKRLIYDGQYDNAEIILDQIPIFPNLDYSWVDDVVRFIPGTNDSLYGKLDARKQIMLTSEDAYLLIGEFLNASADNAKLLILKSIYADKEWADFYISGIMMGYKLNDIYNILLNPTVRDFINSKRGSKLYNSDRFNEYEALNTMPEDFKDVYNLSNLLQLTGKLASINQGFTTNKFDIKNKIKTIEKQVTSIVRSFLKNAGFKDSAKSYNFSLFKYLMEGDNDADTALDQNRINPLKIIFSNPLYKAQWTSYLTAIQISNTLSSKNELEYGMEYKNKKEYKKNVSKLSETINKSWIKSIKYKLTLPEKFRKRIEQNLTVDPEIILNYSNTEIFVKYMEDYAIPKLKSLYPENYFIQSLAPDIRSLENGSYTMFYKIPLNMREIDSDENVREEYGKMFRGFNSLSGVEFEGNKIHELLYLYETLVNRTFSRSSMSRFFSESFATGENALIDSHARYLENKANVDSVVELSEVESAYTPTIYDFGDVRRASYYSEQYSGIDKLMDFEDWKNFDDMIVVFNDDDYIEVLHSYGINDEEAGMVHNIGKAFVYDGKIFINTDKATRDDLRHEISHIIIGVMKASLPSAGVILNNFYELNKSKFTKILIDLSGHSVYKNLKSSDLIEEAIAHWVAYSENNLNDFMRFVSDDKISSLNDFIKDFLSSKGTKNDFISNVSNIQKAETLRNFLMARKGNMSVKEDCK